MKDYRLYDITDFVMDDDFIRWVNEKKNDDNLFWENWLNQHPGKYMVVAEARRILESIGTQRKVIPRDEKQFEIKRLMTTITGRIQVPEQKGHIIPFAKKWRYAAAILLFVAASTATYFILGQEKATEKFAYTSLTASKNLIENINTSGKPIILKLSDGSTVELAGNSRISYSNNFDSIGTRDVYLSGEAFFTVEKDPNRPFRVFANEIVAKVLGTSFRVRSFEKDTVIQVTVRTGKVNVYSQVVTNASQTASTQPGGIILTPNQELVYEKSKQKFQKMLLEKPVMVLPMALEQEMSYEDASLEAVFIQLSKIYGINIVYDNELLKKCTVTADLRNVPFYEKLDLICKAVGASYEVIDGQVVIQANACV